MCSSPRSIIGGATTRGVPAPPACSCGLELRDGPAGHLRWGAADGEAGPPPGRPGGGQLRLAADQQRHPAPGGRRADRELAPGHRLAGPCPVEQLQVGVEAAATVAERPLGQLEVVGAAADPQPEGEAALRDLVEAGRHLGQQHRVVERLQEHVGEQADPLGHGRGRGQGGQRVVARVGDPVDGGQGEKPRASALRASRHSSRPGRRARVGRPCDPHAALLSSLWGGSDCGWVMSTIQGMRTGRRTCRTRRPLCLRAWHAAALGQLLPVAARVSASSR